MQTSKPSGCGNDSGGGLRWVLREGDETAILHPFNASIPKVTAALRFRKQAFYAVQAWEESNGLLDYFRGHGAVWWTLVRNRFIVELADVLLLVDALRSLQAEIKTEPEQVVIEAAELSRQTYATAFKLCFPRCRTTFKNRVGDRILSAANQAVRRVRKRIGLRRLKHLKKATVPRVLLFSTETHWLGGRDKDLWSIDRELRARGVEVITMASAGGAFREKLVGLFTRPGDHIFSEVVEGRKVFLPAEIPPVDPNRFVHEGMDFSFFVRRYIFASTSWDFADLDRQWLGLLNRIAPDYILMAHGQYEGGAIARSAAEAGIRFCLLQHGRITPYHAMYAFPPLAVDTCPLPHRFFVYSREEADILVKSSIFRPDSIVIAGSPEWDPFLGISGGSDHSVPAGQRGSRWLFTSQPGLDESIMRLLVASAARNPGAVRLRIRLHPRETRIEPWQRILREHGVDAELVQTTPLEKDILWCDVHLGFASTCITHAAIAGRPSILLGTYDDPWREQIIAAGLGREVHSPEEVLEASRFWMSEQGHAEFADKRRLFLDTAQIRLQPAAKSIVDALYPRA